MNEIIDRLKNVPVGLDDYVGYLEETFDNCEEVEGTTELFNVIFEFLENHEHVDVGNPGPLVHFIESYYPAYLTCLISSIQRKPVTTSVWMVNRILNAKVNHECRNRLIKALKETIENIDVEESVRDSAKDFLVHQEV